MLCHLYTEGMGIRRWARDIERKSWDRLRMSGHRVRKMPLLCDLPMPWRLGEPEEKKFWWGQNMAMGGDLGLGCPPPGVWLEEVVRRIPWMPASGAGRGGIASATSWAWAHGGRRHRAGAGGW